MLFGRSMGDVSGLVGIQSSGSTTWDPLTAGTLASGLIVDLCPDYAATVTLNAGKVSALSDRSAAANHFAQSTGGAQPTYVASDANFGGRASMTFAGSQQLDLSAASLASLSGGQATIAVVERCTSAASPRMLFSVGGAYSVGVSTAAYWNSASDAKIQAYRSGASQYALSASPAASISATHRWIATCDVSAAVVTGSLYIDGTSRGTGSGASGSGANFSAAKAYLGSGNSFNFVGSIARFLVWNRILSAGEIAALDAGLQSFFGL